MDLCIQHLGWLKEEVDCGIMLSKAHELRGGMSESDSEDRLDPGESSLKNKFVARHILRVKGVLAR